MLKFKKMGTEKIPILLITANVGSIFEAPDAMLSPWISEVCACISRLEPRLLAIHMQEVGGKSYDKSMQYVSSFVQMFMAAPQMKNYDKYRIYLDEDYSAPEKFTALGNMYFVHSSLTDVKIWDFAEGSWSPLEGTELHAGSIQHVPTKEKAKFPQNYFPECKWSRKGYMRTRWLVRGTVLELVNVHLFHDASNCLAAAQAGSPSVYARSRRRALKHLLHHLHKDPQRPPFFIFGDFNFRLDQGGVVKRLTDDLQTNRTHNGKSMESSKMQYRSEDRLVLTVGKKEFSHAEHQKVFREPWVLQYDQELELLKPHLFEFPIKFSPSYPFEENTELPTHFMKTRCPAWCDRVLLSQAARLIIHQKEPSISSSRRSVIDSDSGSPSRSSHRSSGRNSSSEGSPSMKHKQQSPRKALPTQDSATYPEFEGLMVPSSTQSRKSIADPTNIVHAMNARTSEGKEGSPTRRRLTRNQSEGSPKLGENARSELRKMASDARMEYGIIGESTCMGDHKPVYLRVLLQSDRGTVACCGGDTEYPGPPCPLARSPSPDCFSSSPNPPPFRSRLSTDSGFRRSSSKDSPSPRLRLNTNPTLNANSIKVNLQLTKENISNNQQAFNKSDVSSKDSLSDSEKQSDFAFPNVQINIVDAEDDDVSSDEVNECIDPHLLYSYAAPIYPYTPESIDSHSPCPEPCSADSVFDSPININMMKHSVDKGGLNELSGKNEVLNVEEEANYFLKKSLSVGKSDAYLMEKTKSISPRLLKSRLENILKSSRTDVMQENINIDSQIYNDKSVKITDDVLETKNKDQQVDKALQTIDSKVDVTDENKEIKLDSSLETNDDKSAIIDGKLGEVAAAEDDTLIDKAALPIIDVSRSNIPVKKSKSKCNCFGCTLC